MATEIHIFLGEVDDAIGRVSNYDGDTIWAAVNLPTVIEKASRKLGGKGDKVLVVPAKALQAVLRGIRGNVVVDCYDSFWSAKLVGKATSDRCQVTLPAYQLASILASGGNRTP